MAFGAPDWLAARWPVRATMGTNQTRLMLTAAGAIAAGGNAFLDITAPVTHNMIVSSIAVCSPVSCINYFWFQISGVTLYWQYYDMNGQAFFPIDSAPVVPAGATATIFMQNNDAGIQTLRLNVAGTYEEI